MTSLYESLQPANPLTRSSSVLFVDEKKQIVKIIAPLVQVRNKPGRRLGVLVAHLQCDVYERLLDTEYVEKQRWLRLPIGWICSVDENKEATYELVRNPEEAEISWHHEDDKRKRMASAVVAMLVKSFPLPQVKRLVRGIVKHTNNNYPHKPLLQVSKKSIEDIMISLGGETRLTKAQVFEYIKVAAAQQSDPSQSVIDIVAEIAQLVDSRPSHWVVEDLNIIETEEVVRRKNRFVMAAASGDIATFQHLVENSGIELTSLHTELKYTALHAAADFGKHEMIMYIVQTGFSLDVRDPKRGQTALHFAAYNGRENVIRVLLDEYADRHIKNYNNLQPYEIADRQGHFLCREMLKHIPPVVKSIKMKENSVSMIEIEWDPPYQNLSQSSPIIEYFIECIPLDPTVPRNYVSEKSTFTTSATSAGEIVDSMCIERDDVVTKAHTRVKSAAAHKRYVPKGDKVAAATTIRFVQLTAYSEYSFRIKCRSLAGWSAFCEPFVFMTRAFVPDQPEPVEIIKISTNGIAMTWHPPLRANGFPVDYYQIELVDTKTLQQSENKSNQENLIDLQHAADTAVAAVASGGNGGKPTLLGAAPDDLYDDKSQDEPTPNHRISAAALRRKSAIAEQGGLSKFHRILRHKYLDLRYKYLTGLEPYRKYHCRVRAHNQLGYSPWSDWTEPVAPSVGVTVKEYKPEKLSATLTWFEPLLSCGRTVEYYEVQLCVMRGPMTKSVELLTSGEYLRAEEKAREAELAEQSVSTREKVKLAEAAGDCQLDASTINEDDGDGGVAAEENRTVDTTDGSNRDRAGEDLMNEYVTVRADVKDSFLEVTDLKAGGRYKCRVRAKVKEYDHFYEWDRSVESAVFSMAPTPPDPPLHVRPSMAMENIVDKADAINDMDEAQHVPDTNSMSAFSQSLPPAGLNEMSTSIYEDSTQYRARDSSTAVNEQGTALAVQNSLTSSVRASDDIDMNKTAQQESTFRKNLRRNLLIGQKISSQQSNSESESIPVLFNDAPVGSDGNSEEQSTEPVPAELPPSWEITHDSITLTWTNGLANGLPVDEYRIECAKVRTYRVQDVIRARDAFRSELFSSSVDEESIANSPLQDETINSQDNCLRGTIIGGSELEFYDVENSRFPFGSNEPVPINEADSLFWSHEIPSDKLVMQLTPVVKGKAIDSTKAAVQMGRELQERDEQLRQQLWEQRMRLLQHRKQVEHAKDNQRKELQLVQRSADALQWEDITFTRGHFLGPQKFCAYPLNPGTTYIFRVKQKNALGWSKFSRASRMVTTYPSVPPGAPVILSIQRTYVLLRWAVTTLRGGIISKPPTAGNASPGSAALQLEGFEAEDAAADNGLTQLEYEVQIAAVDARISQPRGRRHENKNRTAAHSPAEENEVNIMKLDQIPNSAWRDAEVRDLTARETARLMEADRHHAATVQRTESGRSLVLAQSTSLDDIESDFRMQLVHSPTNPIDTFHAGLGDDLSQIQRINEMIRSPHRTGAGGASATVPRCESSGSIGSDLQDEGFVYKMLQRLPAGTTFVIRVRVRTVVGWSPWSALSNPFRTLS